MEEGKKIMHSLAISRTQSSLFKRDISKRTFKIKVGNEIASVTCYRMLFFARNISVHEGVDLLYP